MVRRVIHVNWVGRYEGQGTYNVTDSLSSRDDSTVEESSATNAA
jgi:hypothetical protein